MCTSRNNKNSAGLLFASCYTRLQFPHLLAPGRRPQIVDAIFYPLTANNSRHYNRLGRLRKTFDFAREMLGTICVNWTVDWMESPRPAS